MSAPDVRRVIRKGHYAGHTAGLAPGCLQANLVIMSAEYAHDFARFCRDNAQACPLVGMSEAGNPHIAGLGADLDVRTDVPRYSVYRHGVLSDQVSDTTGLWSADSVAFAIGCSFTFEHALQRAGVRIAHIDEDRTVPMFKTNIATNPAGPFRGGMVVSMRPIRSDQLSLVFEICERYPQAHGAPVHFGDPSEIGIADLSAPDWGTPSPVANGEVAVFWACGVTPQNALLGAQLPLCITHTPGHMLVTDVDEDARIRSSSAGEKEVGPATTPARAL